MSETMRQWTGLESATGSIPSPRSAQGYALVTGTPWPKLKLGVRADDAAISAIDFLTEAAVEVAATSVMAKEALRQLRQYFRNPHWRFTLPLAPRGTAFQQRVWQDLLRIPAGDTRHYGDVARRLHTSARAVGGACRANPLPLIIPCHRVVAAQGLGGFMGVTAGRGMRIKQCLLAHEASS